MNTIKSHVQVAIRKRLAKGNPNTKSAKTYGKSVNGVVITLRGTGKTRIWSVEVAALILAPGQMVLVRTAAAMTLRVHRAGPAW